MTAAAPGKYPATRGAVGIKPCPYKVYGSCHDWSTRRTVNCVSYAFSIAFLDIVRYHRILYVT